MTMNHVTDQRQSERDRRFDSREAIDLARTRVSWTVLVWIVGAIATCLVTYFAATNTVNARVAVLEARQEGTERRLAEMNSYLQALNAKMDQILLNSARR